MKFSSLLSGTPNPSQQFGHSSPISIQAQLAQIVQCGLQLDTAQDLCLISSPDSLPFTPEVVRV